MYDPIWDAPVDRRQMFETLHSVLVRETLNLIECHLQDRRFVPWWNLRRRREISRDIVRCIDYLSWALLETKAWDDIPFDSATAEAWDLMRLLLEPCTKAPARRKRGGSFYL